MNETIGRQTVSKVGWRLLPIIILMYFLSYLDRVNVSFAALTMNKDLAFTATIYGWGAGLFFVGYFLGEVPSNLAHATGGFSIGLILLVASVALSCPLVWMLERRQARRSVLQQPGIG